MRYKSSQFFFLLPLIIIAIPVVLFAYPFGPPPRHTGAPGDGTCIQSGCHNGTVVNNSSALTLTFPGGLQYTCLLYTSPSPRD